MRVWFVILLLSLCSCNSFGQETSLADWNAREISQLQREFGEKLGAISYDLGENSREYLSNPKAFDKFINLHIAPLWDPRSTTSALLGKTSFAKLSKNEKDGIVAEVQKTWRRYAHQGMKYYDGQSFSVSDIVVNKFGNRAWVQILVKSKLLPDIYFDLMLKKKGYEPWLIVDARFKGITYVSMKKHQFREIVGTESIMALKNFLSKNNEVYFSALCQPIEKKGHSPC